MTVTRENSKQAQRKAAMTVLAHSDAAGIASRLDVLALPDHEILREPENGLVMVRGRIGRDRQKARMIALCDALIQSNEFAEAVEAEVIAPLRAQMISERDRRAAETAATRVDFYTLVRGEG